MIMIKDIGVYGPEELNKIGELLTEISADEIIGSTTITTGANNKTTVRIMKIRKK